jgi:hypothetical protein
LLQAYLPKDQSWSEPRPDEKERIIQEDKAQAQTKIAKKVRERSRGKRKQEIKPPHQYKRYMNSLLPRGKHRLLLLLAVPLLLLPLLLLLLLLLQFSRQVLK